MSEKTGRARGGRIAAAASYTDDTGHAHEVGVQRAGGRWRVLDRCKQALWLVETVEESPEEGYEAAAALAVDYAAQQQAYSDGSRADSPLPRPVELALAGAEAGAGAVADSRRAAA
jgi:hypothetical protein